MLYQTRGKLCKIQEVISMGPGQVHQVLVAVSLLALLAAFNGVNCAIQRDLQHTSAPMNANEVQQVSGRLN